MAFLVLLGPVAGNALTQSCDQHRDSARDSSRFDINDNGTVTDIESGLTWQRCMLGQVWKNGDCSGDARRLTWSEANALVQSGAGTPKDNSTWRIPKLNEIAGIVDIRCRAPRIDLRIFPGTAAQPFWTANNPPGVEDQAYTLSFGAAGVSSTLKSEKHYVRLVRGRD